jgi:hypothetical protein
MCKFDAFVILFCHDIASRLPSFDHFRFGDYYTGCGVRRVDCVPLAHANISQHFHARYITDEKHDCGSDRCLNSSKHLHNAPLCGCRAVRMHHTFMSRFSDRDVVQNLGE